GAADGGGGRGAVSGGGGGGEAPAGSGAGAPGCGVSPVRNARQQTVTTFAARSPATAAFQTHGVWAEARPAAKSSSAWSTAAAFGVNWASLSNTGSGFTSDTSHRAFLGVLACRPRTAGGRW